MDKKELNSWLKNKIIEHQTDVLKRKIKDPWYIVAACSCSLGAPKCFLGVSGKAIESEFDYRLVTRVKGIFNGQTIGDNPGLENWPIGSCAEQHAANEVLKNTPTAVIDLFQFSDAYNTKMPDLPKPYCMICKALFNQLK